ncbi:MAG: hypothetical protein RQ723_11970 [Desulfuromonadales bacterium]|nr:hypothetical protein [Desulfuromonadales bacterium]
MSKCDYMSIAEAAESLQSTGLNVLMHVKRGLLKGKESDGEWWVERASLDALMQQAGGGKAEGVCTRGCAKKSACGGCH